MAARQLTVIGGGVAGCVTALYAAQAGWQVTLHEAATLGAGASGMALGLLVPSDNQTRALDALQRQGCAAWAPHNNTSNNTINNKGLAEKIASLAGVDIATLYRVWPSGAQLHIAGLFQALAVALPRAGVEVILGQSYMPNTAAGVTLWAAGWGNKPVSPTMLIRAGAACRLAPCGLNTLLVGRGGEVQGIYAVPDWDDSVLVGTQNIGTLNAPLAAVPTEALATLRERAGYLFAPLATAPLLNAWVGNRPLGAPRLPLIQPVAEHQYAVTGLGGLGFALSPVVAQQFLQLAS